IVAGSDYPHQIGSLEKMKGSIEKLEISSQEKAGIFAENAAWDPNRPFFAFLFWSKAGIISINLWIGKL
ncbi:hypothetical protein ACFLRM_03260, partial [Acidobacteriota bacterium]